MQLKIEANGKSKVYSLKGKNKVSIGRSPSCDIQIVAEGVSRKHVEITNNKGDVSVIDLGSTNGSFIDENQLKQGQKYTFNTFFPIRMGFNVYVYLLDEN